MAGTSVAESRILDHIDGALMLADTLAWAGINSGSRNLAGLAAMADILADAFGDLPGDVSLVDGAPTYAIAADGSEYLVEHGKHLLLQVRPEAAKRLLFTGHMDTVFAADHPFQDVKWIAEGVVNGPGVADMKGGIAVMLAALQALEHPDAVLGDWGYDVIINSDEEVGSLSSSALIARHAAGKIAAFTYEPSALPDGTLAGARPGSGNFSIIITGRSAHAGRNPEDGRNALVAAADLAVRLKRAARSGLLINPAKIEGGSANNVVPDNAVLRVNIRPSGADDLAIAEQLLIDLQAAVAREHDVTVHLHGGFARPPKLLTAETLALFALVEQAGADLGIPLCRQDSGGVCDGNNIAACGIPVIDTMGVRGGSIHSSEEYMYADSLAERARLSALSIMRLLEQGSL